MLDTQLNAKLSVNLFTLHCSSSFSRMYNYLAIGNGGYLHMNIIQALLAAWLNALQGNQDGVQLNKSARKGSAVSCGKVWRLPHIKS